ncbi:hypothetical protein [Methylobacterium sp. B4]|uniref:hypothetical protein n=1 Tax=Methylobacterium sp. B4 TaxID=1938755 RepID=UPI000D75D2C3|nr:hypothetical protein [Methylobacterium sp. B4]PXW62111.1 hypothetical protein BY998_10798 [Methylobacterium sp. B4]
MSRQLVAVAAGAGATMASTSAQAYQGRRERALSPLFDALASFREASSNKGGHRVEAMALVQQAIEQMQAGIESADDQGGGGGR